MPTAKEVDNTFSSDPLTSISSRSLSFDFGERRIHAFERKGEAFFVANEVAAALGYSDTNQAIRKHCKGAEICKTVDLTLLGLRCDSPRGLTIIPERDVYRLIMRSKLPAAEAFEEKVVGEVLPAIRKTGGYIAAAPEETVEQLTLRVMTVLKDTVERQKQQIESMAPKAEALDLISASEGDLGVRDAGRELKVGERWVTSTILARNWACKQGRKLRPAHYGLTMGYVRLCARVYRDRNTGETCVADDFKITRKGVGRLGELIVAKRLSNVEAV